MEAIRKPEDALLEEERLKSTARSRASKAGQALSHVRKGKKNASPAHAADRWRQTVGMFGDDPIMAEIAEAGKRIRDSERRRS